MAKIKNTWGEDRIVPWLNNRLILDGAVVDVPDADVYAYTCQPGWEPADKAAREAHGAAVNPNPEPDVAPDNPTEG